MKNRDFYFREGITWSLIGLTFGPRYTPKGFIFDVGGSSAFPTKQDHLWVTGFLCSKQVFGFMKVMNPTLNFQVGNVASLPVLRQRILGRESDIEKIIDRLIDLTRADWDAYERSWDLQSLPLLKEHRH